MSLCLTIGKHSKLNCSHSSQYQYTFFPNTQWSAFYAPGSEILAYLQNVVSTYQLEKYIKLQHEMVGAKWDDAAGKWRVNIKRPKLGADGSAGTGGEMEVFEDTADLLFTGIGALSRWNWPDIEGLKAFKGTLIHSAKWEVPGQSEPVVGSPQVRQDWEGDVKDWGNKRVAVIGVVRSPFLRRISRLTASMRRVLQRFRSSLPCNARSARC